MPLDLTPESLPEIDADMPETDMPEAPVGDDADDAVNPAVPASDEDHPDDDEDEDEDKDDDDEDHEDDEDEDEDEQDDEDSEDEDKKGDDA